MSEETGEVEGAVPQEEVVEEENEVEDGKVTETERVDEDDKDRGEGRGEGGGEGGGETRIEEEKQQNAEKEPDEGRAEQDEEKAEVERSEVGGGEGATSSAETPAEEKVEQDENEKNEEKVEELAVEEGGVEGTGVLEEDGVEGTGVLEESEVEGTGILKEGGVEGTGVVEEDGVENDAVQDEGETKKEEGVPNDQEGTVGMESGDSHVTPSNRAPLENIIEEEEEEEEEADVDRIELIASCQDTLRRQERLRRENAQLQHKIAEYLSHKKEEKTDPGRNVTDQEKTYHQCMSALDRLEAEMEENRAQWVEKEEEVREMCVRVQAEVQEKTEEFLKYQETGARQAVDSLSGHRLSDLELKRLQTAQHTSDQAVFQARLENIKLGNKIERMEHFLKQKEQLAEGLHMLDFEQLKISNMDLGEKVEERNEDIRKLTDKITDTVQVLTHVKEKLNFLQDESEEKKELLGQLDFDLARRREMLTRLKQARDSLRLDNRRLKQRGGLVSHTQLLRDFEDRQDENVELHRRLEELQTQHSHTSVQCAGLRRKIDQTTSHITHSHHHHHSLH